MIQLTQSTPRTPFIKYLITAGPSSNCLCPSHLAQHVHSNTKITSNCKGEAFVTKQLVESSNIATQTSYQVLKSTSFLPIIAALSNCTYFLL